MQDPDRDLLPARDPNEPIPDEYIISVPEVEKQLMHLDISKSPGPDNIPTDGFPKPENFKGWVVLVLTTFTLDERSTFSILTWIVSAKHVLKLRKIISERFFYTCY